MNKKTYKYPVPLEKLQYPYMTELGDSDLGYYVGEHYSILENMRCQISRKAILDAKIPGVLEVTVTQMAFMVHFDPLRIAKDELAEEILKIEESISDINTWEFDSTIIEAPIWLDDPWSMEMYLKYKDRHQVKDGSMSNFKYCAQLNNMTPEEFENKLCSIPYWVDITGFVLGIMGEAPMYTKREDFPVVPKYEMPRPQTPEREFGAGGIQFCIYPYPEPGGYQLLGVCAVPVYSREKILEPFKEKDILCNMGDILIHRSIKEKEYNEIRAQVKEGTYQFKMKKRKLYARDWAKQPEKFVKQIMEGF